jgi:hypothetical protein
MAKQKPAKTLEGFSLVRGSQSPLFFTHFIDSGIESFDDMEAIQNQGNVGAVIIDCTHIGSAHITACPLDLLFLVGTEFSFEEGIDGVPAFAPTDPDHAGSVEVIDNGGVLFPFGVGDLVNTDRFQSSDSMAVADSGNRPVQEFRKGRLRNAQYGGGSFLRHLLGIDHQDIFESIGYPGVAISPGDILLYSSVSGALDFSWAIEEANGPSADRKVAPASWGIHRSQDAATTSTFGATGSVLIGFDQ